MIATIEAAEAVKDALNGASWSESFTAERDNCPVVKLTQLATLKVIVAGQTVAIDAVDRGTREDRYTVEVGVMKRVDPHDNAETDPLIRLTEAIGEWFFDRELAVGAGVGAVVEVEVLTLDRAHADANRQYTGVVTLTIEVTEDR